MLSNLTLKRPIFGTVLALLLITFGVVAFTRLSVREFPSIDPPIVSIRTTYPGAAASIVESRITELIEENIAGIEGISFIESRTEDSLSIITLEFDVKQDIDAATNDVRDAISRMVDSLPSEVDFPSVRKVDSDEDVIVWLNLSSPSMSLAELTDYARRVLVDRFSTISGVGRVRLFGGREYAMRIWIDRIELAARGLTVADIEQALRADNVELPAGGIESKDLLFSLRLRRAFNDADDFSALAVGRTPDGRIVRLGEVARVERAASEERSIYRGNSIPMVGIGIIKQSTANTIDVARGVIAEAKRINQMLPDGMDLDVARDSSVFIEGSIAEVYKTLAIAIILVMVVIYVFIGSIRATLVPAITVPIALIGTFIFLLALGFSINLLTLLGLVLAIGLVVDDAIVVLENISRRIHEEGETPLVAAYRGTQQVFFAIVATTLVLVSVFIPIAFLQGTLGRLFSEFAFTMVAAVLISSFVALSQSPIIAAKFLQRDITPSKFSLILDRLIHLLNRAYSFTLDWTLRRSLVAATAIVVMTGVAVMIYRSLPSEYAPQEDRGTFFISVRGPEGASHSYMAGYVEEIERRLMPYVESGEIRRLLARSPRAFGNTSNFNTGWFTCVLTDWGERRNAWIIIDEINRELRDLAGVRVSTIMRSGVGSRTARPVQFVVGGNTYEELAIWRDLLLAELEKDNPGILNIDWDYKETKPQVEIEIDYTLAATLGVNVNTIGRTLETMLGSRRVTRYLDNGKEYDVLLEGERDSQRTPASLQNIFVRSGTTGSLIPLSSLVSTREKAASNQLNRYNRMRAITFEANLAPDLSLGQALDHLEALVLRHLPPNAIIDYKGQSLDFKRSGGSIWFVFLLGLIVVFLVLAAQFESWLNPLIIMLTVPLAIFGGLLGIFLTGGTLNIYSQIGLIVLVGLATKNGVLIVDFANQLRDSGMAVESAIRESCRIRLRPILMTAVTTAAGALPLVFSTGPGQETREQLGVVILFGVLIATITTLYIIPVAYRIIAPYANSPMKQIRRLESEMGNSSRLDR
jgi:multidrug efflux pump